MNSVWADRHWAIYSTYQANIRCRITKSVVGSQNGKNVLVAGAPPGIPLGEAYTASRTLAELRGGEGMEKEPRVERTGKGTGGKQVGEG